MDANNPVKPPDMVGAGITPPAPQPQGMVDMLRSQGSMPSAALSMMAPAPMANPYAAALAGGLGGQNPVLQQQHQGAQDQMQQQRMQMEMQNRREDREMRRQDAALKMSQTMLASDNPVVKAAGAKGMGSVWKSMGLNIDNSVIEAMGEGHLSSEDRKSIIVELASGYTQDMVLASHPGLKPQDLRGFLKISENPRARKMLGIPSDEALESEKLDFKLKQVKLAEAMVPQLKSDPKTLERAMIIHGERFQKGFMQGDDFSRNQAIKEAILQQRKEKIADETQLMVTRERLAANLAEAKMGAQPVGLRPGFFVNSHGDFAPPAMGQKEAISKGFFAVTPKEAQDLSTSQQAFTILQNIKATITEMKKEHLFVESGGAKSLYEGSIIQGKKYLGDPEGSKRLLRNFDSQKAQMVILLRQLGDKGVRALGAFEPIMGLYTPMAGAPAVELTMSNVESEIRAIGKAMRMPDAYSDIPEIFPASQYGAGVRTQPSPLAPPPSVAPPGFRKVQ